MSRVLDVAGASIALPGDRGARTVRGVPFDAYFAFGAAVREFQRANPDTIVRSRGRFDRNTGVGEMTVTWWPRGESEEGA